MVAIGATYPALSTGLATPVIGAPFICSDLRSLGGDDDVVVFSFTLFMLPLFIRIFRIRHKVGRADHITFWFCVLGVATVVFGATDCADIFYTAFLLPDAPLALALVSMPVSALALWQLSKHTPQP